jgi:hypothetical protein
MPTDRVIAGGLVVKLIFHEGWRTFHQYLAQGTGKPVSGMTR